jgi:nucleotide-binding universal stress UspA family protein
MVDELHVLLCYDGSDGATEAIHFAAALFPPHTRATVLCVWEPIAVAVSAGYAFIPPDSDDRDEASAKRLAEAATEQARVLGLEAEARTERAQASAWQTIVDVADDEFDVIVMGTRGLSGLRSLLMGSCSHHVAQHAPCPVLIVPGAELQQERRRAAQANAGAGT